MDDKNNILCCPQCNKTFVRKGSFVRHLNEGHKPKQERRNVEKYKCPLCGVSSIVNFEQFKDHVFQSHEVSLQMHFYKFQSQSRFLAWKRKIEEQTRSSYVKESMIFRKNLLVENKPFITKKVGVINYKCHRSGYFRLQKDESERKRKFKAHGSVKINAFCPSKISAVFRKNGSVKVVYCSTHVGHECDITHLRLTEDERREIAAKVAANIPFDDILNEIKSTAGSSISRKHILCKKDLQIIKQSLLRKGNQSVNTLLASNNYQSNIEFSTNDRSLEDSYINLKPDELEEFEDSEIQTYDPNDPESDSEILSNRVGIENDKSSNGISKKGCSTKLKRHQLENNRPIFRRKSTARNKLNLDELTVSQRQSVLIEKFRSTVSNLNSLNDVKWVENHINRMFIVLKSMKDRRSLKKKESYVKPKLIGKSVSKTNFIKTEHSSTNKTSPASQKTRSKLLLPVSSPQNSRQKVDFQVDLVRSQLVLKNGEKKSNRHSKEQSNSNGKVDLKTKTAVPETQSDPETPSSCSAQIKQYLVPIAGKPDQFLIVQTKANEPPPVGPLTPVTPSQNRQPVNRNIPVAIIDHNYSSL